jgi:calcineurin-like phosphoesterase family protein
MNEKVSKTYIIADTHFNHTLMQKYCGRPPNFNKLIINQWRATVRPQDIVYHLGDVIWGKQEELIQIMNNLPGTKILVKGNHDKNHSNNWFIQAGFAVAVDKIQVGGVILSHFPAIMLPEEIEFGLINIHGHFHNAPPERWETKLKEHITDHHFLLNLEDNEYRPVSLEAVKKGKCIKNSKKILDNLNHI